MRSEGYCSWACLCVCVSVKSNLTSGASARPENTVTYSAGKEGQKICGVFSETTPFKSCGVIVACNYPLSAYMNCNSSLW